MQFSMPGDVRDIVTYANFCENQLRGFGVGRGLVD